MIETAWKTLFHPFERGVLELPAAGERWLFVGAAPGFRAPEGFRADLTLVQGFRPWFNALKASGYDVAPSLDEVSGPFDGALVLLGRHRGENEAWLRAVAKAVRPGGFVVAAGFKTDGVESLRKRLGGQVSDLEHVAKYHGSAFWFAAPEDMAGIIEAPDADALVEGRFHTAPGMFSHGRVDAGSKLLATYIPEDLNGHVADFGAGWGYLSASACERCPGISAIDLYEADHAALEAARRNLAGLATTANFHWLDLTGEPVTGRYDTIVMNPPFHTGRAASPALGQAFIAQAARSLKPGGRLFMVANRHLPYEAALGAHFKTHDVLADAGGYKVIAASSTGFRSSQPKARQ